MNGYYFSQHGEDYLICELFKNRTDGVFVEVGCVDGLRFSNTLKLAKLGWSGICIEPHPKYIEKMVENRPESEIYELAAGDEDKESVTFYAEERAAVSSLVPPNERQDQWQSKSYEQISVPMRTLDSIMSESKYNDIDLLSIDVEGYESEVLDGLNFEIYEPKLIIVEENGLSELKKYIPSKYERKFRITNNGFYIHPDLDYDLKNINLNPEIKLRKTEHPLDNEGDDVYESFEVNIKNID